MAKVVFASSLTRWLPAGAGGGEASVETDADTIGAALDGAFSEHPSLRGYVLDEQGALRHHVAVFVDGEAVRHGAGLDMPLPARAEVYVIQALSGG